MSAPTNTSARSYIAEIRIIRVEKTFTQEYQKPAVESRSKKTLATVVVGDSDLVQLLNKVHGHLELVDDSGDINE